MAGPKWRRMQIWWEIGPPGQDHCENYNISFLTSIMEDSQHGGNVCFFFEFIIPYFQCEERLMSIIGSLSSTQMVIGQSNIMTQPGFVNFIVF